jgi:hypothetical protein
MSWRSGGVGYLNDAPVAPGGLRGLGTGLSGAVCANSSLLSLRQLPSERGLASRRIIVSDRRRVLDCLD